MRGCSPHSPEVSSPDGSFAPGLFPSLQAISFPFYLPRVREGDYDDDFLITLSITAPGDYLRDECEGQHLTILQSGRQFEANIFIEAH
ncbi:hypothetical protein CDAR_525391 [Caerostris darwini]|uniref:Uncharacterized protein n=1 Tax=Caerostris darwini TaxID=1538125 RepID=A0AAV4RM68_9ARAC|nr:hypothetical protein CDAR_525391 [Caerostris darwini]